MTKNKGIVNLESEKPGNLVNVTKVNLISLVLNAEKIKEIGLPQSFGTVRFSLTIGSLRIDDFPEDDDVSTLEVVYANALPDVALFLASS